MAEVPYNIPPNDDTFPYAKNIADNPHLNWVCWEPDSTDNNPDFTPLVLNRPVEWVEFWVSDPLDTILRANASARRLVLERVTPDGQFMQMPHDTDGERYDAEAEGGNQEDYQDALSYTQSNRILRYYSPPPIIKIQWFSRSTRNSPGVAINAGCVFAMWMSK